MTDTMTSENGAEVVSLPAQATVAETDAAPISPNTFTPQAPSGELASAYIKAQQKMGPLLRNAENPHFRSSYADLASVMGTITDPLLEYGLMVMQIVELDPDGNLQLVTRLIHESGEVLEGGVYPIMVSNLNDPQKVGSAITYARRYSLMTFFGIAPEDDDGNAAAGHNTSNAPSPKGKRSSNSGKGSGGPTEAQQGFIKDLLNQNGYTTASDKEKRVKEIVKKGSKSLTSADARKLIDALKAERDEEKSSDDPADAPF